ncbi:hypothetical protein OHA21_11970 [Actinoplanes sp. NBC_00393]|uniref:hypothetical protein n=1 Tax=Actinoplanes sp. NBC_00393 TaxID=2975953 RepID=UPI002E1CF3AF
MGIGRDLRLPVAKGRPPLVLRLTRVPPYPPETIRSVTLLFDAGRLWIDVTAELPVAVYAPGHEPDRARVAGVDRSAARGAGVRPGAGPGWSKPGIAAGSGRRCTKPRRPWWAGRSSTGSAS